MVRKELGYKVIRIIYNDFKEHFRNGNILIGGSFYYGQLGFPSSYKDVDFVVDERAEYDHIVKDIYNKYIEPHKGFLGDYRGKLTAGFDMFGDYHVDVIRNDFSDNLSPFEIIPGIFTYRQSDKRLAFVYKEFLEAAETLKNPEYRDVRIEKFKKLKGFFELRNSKPQGVL